MGKLESVDKHLQFTFTYAFVPCTNQCVKRGEIFKIQRRYLQDHLVNRCPQRQVKAVPVPKLSQQKKEGKVPIRLFSITTSDFLESQTEESAFKEADQLQYTTQVQKSVSASSESDWDLEPTTQVPIASTHDRKLVTDSLPSKADCSPEPILLLEKPKERFTQEQKNDSLASKVDCSSESILNAQTPTEFTTKELKKKYLVN